MRTYTLREKDVSCSAQRSHEELFEQVMREQSASLFHYIYRFIGDYDAASCIPSCRACTRTTR